MLVVKQGGDAYEAVSDHDVPGRRKNKVSLSDNDDDDDDDENQRGVEDEDEYDSEEDEDYDDRPKKKKKRNAGSQFIVDEAGKHIYSVCQYNKECFTILNQSKTTRKHTINILCLE